MERYCNTCISWRSRGLRPFGKCRLTKETIQDLDTCNEHITHDEARQVIARWQAVVRTVGKLHKETKFLKQAEKTCGLTNDEFEVMKEMLGQLEDVMRLFMTGDLSAIEKALGIEVK